MLVIVDLLGYVVNTRARKQCVDTVPDNWTKARTDNRLTSMPSCDMLTDPGPIYHTCFGSKIELVKLDDSRQIYFVSLRLLFKPE